jgi:hypothetical protein
LNFFFDNNLSAHLAHGMRELSKTLPEVQQVVHLSDLFPRDVADVTWIPQLAETGSWYVISIDKFKKQRGAERDAIKSAGHTVFVLDPQWSKHKFWMQAERLVKWWPQIVGYARVVSGGTYRIPWQHSPSAKLQAI